MRMGDVLGPPYSVVYNHLLCLDHVEGEVVILVPHCQVSELPICCLIVAGDRSTTVLLSSNLMMVLETEWPSTT